jgi:hypothetical protein
MPSTPRTTTGTALAKVVGPVLRSLADQDHEEQTQDLDQGEGDEHDADQSHHRDTAAHGPSSASL